MKSARIATICAAAFVLASGVSGGAHAADAMLELRGFKLTYAEFGPVRKDPVYLPGECINFRCDLHGFGLTEDGETNLDFSAASLELPLEVRDPEEPSELVAR